MTGLTRRRHAGERALDTDVPSTRAQAAPRSHLLAVAAATSLVMALLVGAAVATLASAHVGSSMIGVSASADRELARSLLEKLGTAALAEPATPADRARVVRTLERAATDVGMLGIALVGPDGAPWASAGSEHAAAQAPEAGNDEPGARLVDGPEGPRLLEWFPVQIDGRTVAGIGFVRDGTTAVAAVAAAQREIAIAAGVGSGVLIVLVFVIFRGAQRRLDEQTRQLIEVTRRDPLTGQLNHGAVVSELTAAVSGAAQPVAVALVDVDNFRQVNELHGLELGDAVVRRAAAALGATPSTGTSIGRSGPDEFLVVSRGTDASGLAAWLEEVRRELAAAGIDTPSGDRLPFTISAGIAVAPLHGRTASELLSSVGMTLGEAKSGGGDQVLISRLSYAELLEDRRAAFSTLDGLVTAIDTRDRYTRRHSEDVARYALFLAGQLGLDERIRGALHQASLLHDVGKIAVPDRVLRKPAALSGEEMEIVKQHVTLGSLLVQDLAGGELVVEGVRHHHERWDGSGYPDGLAGEAIPLAGRVIAIADAYSAMTTTRPYRRALPRAVALERLAAAAGSQLDPRLVDVFVLAMESQADAPLPSDPRGPTAWLTVDAAA